MSSLAIVILGVVSFLTSNGGMDVLMSLRTYFTLNIEPGVPVPAPDWSGLMTSTGFTGIMTSRSDNCLRSIQHTKLTRTACKLKLVQWGMDTRQKTALLNSSKTSLENKTQNLWSAVWIAMVDIDIFIFLSLTTMALNQVKVPSTSISILMVLWILINNWFTENLSLKDFWWFLSIL